MKKNILIVILALLFIAANDAHSFIYLMKIKDPITPPVADYISEGISDAEKTDATLIVIMIDTPGGLDTAMRDCIESIMRSNKPVCVYVAPSGARAASAGALIGLSAHFLVMAPGTNIGAAHPVNIGGGNDDKIKEQKAVNDAKAYAESIANYRGRNKEIAKDFVEKSISLSAEDAVKSKIADFIAKDMQELSRKLNGRKIKLHNSEIDMKTTGVKIEEKEMNFKHSLLRMISQPNIAYILMIIGIAGLFLELSNPGLIFPGVLGSVSLLLSFYSLHILSDSATGILLIVLGLALIIAEMFIVSKGLLGIGGTVSFVTGNIMLYRGINPILRFDWLYMVLFLIMMVSFIGIAFYLAIKSQFRKPLTGEPGLIGKNGKCVFRASDTEGKVFVNGEWWNARFQGQVSEGDAITVLEFKEGVLVVKKNT